MTTYKYMLPPYKSLNITSSLGFVAIAGFAVAIEPFVLKAFFDRKHTSHNKIDNRL